MLPIPREFRTIAEVVVLKVHFAFENMDDAHQELQNGLDFNFRIYRISYARFMRCYQLACCTRMLPLLCSREQGVAEKLLCGHIDRPPFKGCPLIIVFFHAHFLTGQRICPALDPCLRTRVLLRTSPRSRDVCQYRFPRGRLATDLHEALFFLPPIFAIK